MQQLVYFIQVTLICASAVVVAKPFDFNIGWTKPNIIAAPAQPTFYNSRYDYPPPSSGGVGGTSGGGSNLPYRYGKDVNVNREDGYGPADYDPMMGGGPIQQPSVAHIGQSSFNFQFGLDKSDTTATPKPVDNCPPILTICLLKKAFGGKGGGMGDLFGLGGGNGGMGDLFGSMFGG